MVEIIILLLPALLSFLIDEYREKDTSSLWEKKFFLFVCYFVVDVCVFLLMIKILKGNVNIFELCKMYPIVMIKAILLSVFVGTMVPISKIYLIKKIKFDKITFVKWSGTEVLKKKTNRFWVIFNRGYIYAISFVGILINVFRCVDNNFWGDESYTILKVANAEGILEAARCDVANPPFYFMILKLLMNLMGENPFVYHFASTLPYILFVIFILMHVKKIVGKDIASIFLTILTFMPSALEYWVEVRMYSWSIFFVFLCFWGAYLLVSAEGKKVSNWILFCVGGIGAAYSHYFAFAAIILIYFMTYARLVIINRKNIMKCIISLVVSLVAYAPWMKVFVDSVSMVSGNFWIEGTVSYRQLWDYVFQSDVLLGIYVISVITCIILDLGLLCIERDSVKGLRIQIGTEKLGKLGVVSWFGIATFFIITIFWGFECVYAKLIRPVFIIRYLYPVLAVFWFVLAASILKVFDKFKSFVLPIVLVVLLIVYIPRDIELIETYYKQNKASEKTVEMVNDYLLTENEVVLMTDINHLNWTVLDYYFPNVKRDSYNFEHSWLQDEEDVILLFVGNAIDQNEEFMQFVSDNDYVCNFVGKGKVASYKVNVYEVKKGSKGNMLKTE